MRIYVYGCENKHRLEVPHEIGEDPEIICPECDEIMFRVPQPFEWGNNADETLLDELDDSYRDWKDWRRKVPQGNVENMRPDMSMFDYED